MRGVSSASEVNQTEEERMLHVPTLLIGTANDPICPPAFQEAGMKPYVKNLTVEIVQAGHWVMLEKPDEAFKAIDKFVQSNA